MHDTLCITAALTYFSGMPGGPLGWLYPFEIQPLETRPAGGAVASLMNLLFSFVIGQRSWPSPLSLSAS